MMVKARPENSLTLITILRSTHMETGRKNKSDVTVVVILFLKALTVLLEKF